MTLPRDAKVDAVPMTRAERDELAKLRSRYRELATTRHALGGVRGGKAGAHVLKRLAAWRALSEYKELVTELVRGKRAA